MLNLISFEIKKLFKFQNLFLKLLILLIINLIGIFYIQNLNYDDPIKYNEYNLEVIERYRDLSLEELDRTYKDDYQKLSILNDLYRIDVDSELYQKLIIQYRQENTELLEAYFNNDIKYNAKEINILMKVLENNYHEKKMIIGYKDDVQSTIDQSLSMSSISIFMDSDISISNIKKTAQDYQNIVDITPIYANHLAGKVFLEENYTFVIIAVAFMIAIFSLTVLEKNSGMNSLSITTINGKRITIVAKLIALTVYLFLITIIFYMMNIIYFDLFYGFDNLNDAIQSIYGYNDITLKLSIAEMMLIKVFYTFITILVIGIIVYTLIYILNNVVLVGGILLIFLVIEALLVTLVSSSSSIGILNYLNIFTIFNYSKVLYKYHNIVLFNTAFNLRNSILVVLLFISIISIILLLKVKPIHFKFKKIFKFDTSFFSTHTSILIHEVKRSLIQNKGIIILSLLAIYLITSLNSYQDIYVNSHYEEMIERFGGEINEDKLKKISNYQIEIDRLNEELVILNNQFNQKQISSEEYYPKVTEIETKLNKANSFSRIVNTVESARGNNRGIVNEEGFNLLFEQNLNNNRLNGVMINYFVIVIALILCVAPLCINDRFKGSNRLYGVTILNKRRMLSKQVVMIIYCLVIAIMYGLFKYYAISKCNNLSFGQFGFGSIITLSELFNFDIPLYWGFILVSIIRFIVLLLIGEIVLFISNRSKSLLEAITFVTLLVLGPNLIIFIVPEITKYLLIDYFINSYAFVLNIQFFIKLISETIIIFVLSYCNSKINDSIYV